MVRRWRVLSAHYCEKLATAENQKGSYPRPGLGDQVMHHTNSGSGFWFMRNDRSTVDEPTILASRHFDLAGTTEPQQACRGLLATETGIRPTAQHLEKAQCAVSDGCAQLATEALAAEDRRNAAVVAGLDDRVVRSFCRALEAAERQNDHLCAEARRIAIAVTLLGVETEIRTGVKPIQAKGRQVQALQKWRLKRVVEYIDSHLSEKITLSGLGAVAGLSPMHFASQFRMATSLRPHEFVLRQRVRRTKALLQNTTKPIIEIALAVGFQTQAHFTTVFRRIVGITPHRWRGMNKMQSAPNARDAGRAEASVAASCGFGSA